MWEYKIVAGGQNHLGPSDGEMLNRMGEDGWELVAVFDTSSGPGRPQFYLKRQKAIEVTTT